MRWIINYTIITALVSLVTACYLLGMTSAGLQYDLAWVAKILPGELKIEKISGTLFTEWHLQNISYRSPQNEITIQSFDLKWNPIQWLHGKRNIEQLDVSHVTVKLSDNSYFLKPSKNHASFLQHFSIDQLTLNDITVLQPGLSIYLNGKVNDHWMLLWKIKLPQLNLFSSELSGALNSSGNISGRRLAPLIQASLAGQKLAFENYTIQNVKGSALLPFDPSAHAVIQLHATGIQLPHYFLKQMQWDIKAFRQNHDFSSLQTTWNVSVEHRPLMQASIELSDFLHFQSGASAHITFHLPDLKKLDPFLPMKLDLEGKIAGQIDVNGEWSKPKVTGSALLTKGAFSIPFLGIHPNQISLQLNLEEESIPFQGHFQSGQGKATIQGKVNLNEPHFPLTAAIKGEQIQAIHLPDYKATISPDVRLSFTYPTLSLQGAIFIPFAEMLPKKVDGITTLPDEVVIIDRAKPSFPFLWDTALKLHIALGKNVIFHYDHLQAMLNGDLFIIKQANSPMIATGELHTIEGRYSAYGQTLKIKKGRVIYTGNTLQNPGLYIEATKEVERVLTQAINEFSSSAPSTPIYMGRETIQLGVRVTGTVEHPTISLFSTSDNLSQGDILSYLLLGFPQSFTSTAQSATVLRLLTSLHPNGGTIMNITEKLQKTLGLTELNVSSVQNFNPISNKIESNPSFVVGKQLTDKLSVHYSIGLFEPVSILNFRYQINPQWAIQSETSTIDNGADLVYVFERE